MDERNLHHCCCFVDEESNKPVPLKGIKVSIDVQGYLVNIASTLSYENDGDKSIEAIFNFPIDESSAVYKFETEIDGKVIVAECQEKEDAKKAYEQAVEQGYTASYLGENDSTSDIFSCKVGNLLPKKKATVRFAYVSELKLQEDGSLNFVLPTLLNPRYNPSVETGGSQEEPKTKYVKGCDQPYGFDVEATVDGIGKILDIKSAKDKLNITYEKDGQKALVKLSEPFIADHDFEFQIFVENANAPKVLIEKGVDSGSGILKQDMLMLNFFPSLKESSTTHKHEFIFIIDRSGSMGGTRIQDAKESLLLFLKSLPVGCYFNIIGFGSAFEPLFKEASLPYSEETLKFALEYQKNLEADMGGTEILEPLTYIYKKPVIASYSRQILLITDGEVYNTGFILQLVRKHSHTTRAFTLGIGEGASTSLIKGVARAGRGKAEFVKTGEKMQPVVMRLLKFAMQSSVTDVSIDWRFGGSPKLTQVPPQLPPIYSRDRFIVYALVDSPAVLDGRVVLKGKIGEDEVTFPIEVDGSKNISQDDGYLPVHRMAAKLLIKDLQDSDDDKKQNKSAIVVLSLAANVISNYTSMVGIDKTKNEVVDGFVAQCVIPNVLDPTLGYSSGPMMANYRCSPRSFIQSQPLKLPARNYCAFQASPACYDLDMQSDCMPQSASAFDASKHMPKLRGGGSGPCPNTEELKAASPLSQFLRIIDLAEFDGHWKLSDELSSLVSIKSTKLKSSSPHKNLDAWTTAVVLTYFRIKCADQKDEWEMIEAKAIQWLHKQDLGKDSVDEFLEKAKKLID